MEGVGAHKLPRQLYLFRVAFRGFNFGCRELGTRLLSQLDTRGFVTIVVVPKYHYRRNRGFCSIAASMQQSSAARS